MPEFPNNEFPMYSDLTALTTVVDWIRWCASEMERTDCFYGHGFENPWDESRFLVLRVLRLDWTVPDHAYRGTLIESERQKLYQLIARRCVEKIPTAYLLEEAWFCNEPFWVTNQVLVPRSPIAELIQDKFSRWLDQRIPTHVLDLCTGSGCIGIAMARVFPETLVDVTDLSDAAIEIAVENISTKDLGYQITAYQGDLFDSLPDTRYDLIVSNPPYVDLEDISDMPEEYSHEPRMGLVAGDDGLDIVKRILMEASNHLTPDGWLVCEVGNSAMTLVETFPEVPFEWPEFSVGGHGVFVISASDLIAHQTVFMEQ